MWRFERPTVIYEYNVFWFGSQFPGSRVESVSASPRVTHYLLFEGFDELNGAENNKLCFLTKHSRLETP